MIYAMKRTFKSGRVAKSPIVYFDAVNVDEAFRAFNADRYWAGYHENVNFVAEPAQSVPKHARVVNAAELISAVEEYELDLD